jgi:hypothetical protein
MRKQLIATGLAAVVGLLGAEGVSAASVGLSKGPGATAEEFRFGVELDVPSVFLEAVDGRLGFDPAGLQFVSLSSSVFAAGDILTHATGNRVNWTATSTAGVSYSGGAPLFELLFRMKPGAEPTLAGYKVELQMLAVNESEYMYDFEDARSSNLDAVGVEQRVGEVPLPATVWLLLGVFPLFGMTGRG